MKNEDNNSKKSNQQFNTQNQYVKDFNSLIKDTDNIDPKSEFRSLSPNIQNSIIRLTNDLNRKKLGATKQIGNIRRELMLGKST